MLTLGVEYNSWSQSPATLGREQSRRENTENASDPDGVAAAEQSSPKASADEDPLYYSKVIKLKENVDTLPVAGEDKNSLYRSQSLYGAQNAEAMRLDEGPWSIVDLHESLQDELSHPPLCFINR